VNRTVASFFSIFILPPISRFFARERETLEDKYNNNKKKKFKKAGSILEPGICFIEERKNNTKLYGLFKLIFIVIIIYIETYYYR